MENTQQAFAKKAEQIAKTSDDFLVKKYSKKRVQGFFGKLGSSLGIVVTVLPFAGLLLALGGIATSRAGDNQAVLTLGLILSDLGNAAYANLGLLFMLAIIMGFTGFKGMAVYSSIIGYIAFVGFTIPFIRYQVPTTGIVDGHLNNPLVTPEKFNLWFWKDLSTVTQLDNVFGLKEGTYLPTAASSNGFARFSYQGIKTLNTGVLGGITLGFVYSWIFNKTKDMKLPNILSFFEGEKFTSVLLLIAAPVIASLFIIIWPAVNYALGYIGIGLSHLPYGIDTLLYGTIFQFLLPFMAHMAFIAPLWWTSAGGQLSTNEMQILEAMMHRVATGGTAGIAQEATYYADTIKVWASSIHGVNGATLQSFMEGLKLNGHYEMSLFTDPIKGLSQFVGTGTEKISQGTYDSIIKGLTDYQKLDWSGAQGDQLISVELLTKNPQFDLRDAWSANLRTTRFITGGFANDLFMLPAAGFGMWATLDGERRKQKFGLYLGAILSSFIFGVSEPIIFMFAFACPLIYFLVYAPLFGILSWASIFLQAKVGSTFSQGLMDYVINGIIPTISRSQDGVSQTRVWLPVVVGAVAFTPAMFGFRALFLKAEFAAPGSFAAEEGIGTSQSRYDTIKPSYEEFVEFVGGAKNIETMKINSDGSATINVKKPTDVLTSNSYSESNVQRIINEGNTFTFYFKPRKGVNMDYVQYINDAVDLENREKEFKAILKADKKQVKSDEKLAKESPISGMTKKDIKQFKLLVKHYEKLNEIDASWRFKEDKLEATTAIDMLKFNHELKVWELKHTHEKEVLKANYQMGLKLIASGYSLNNHQLVNKNDIKSQTRELKENYEQELNGIVIDKNAIKSEKANFKAELKRLEAEKKATFDKEKTE